MAHQVNFYLASSDTEEIEFAFREISSLIVLHSRSPTPLPRELESLEFVESGKHWLYFYLVRPEDVKNVVMIHVPDQNYWSVDIHRSPAVQFNRCFFDGKTLKRGRIYYVDQFYGPNKDVVVKSEDFRNWAKSLFKTAKKKLEKHGSDYIGQEAKKWLECSGGILSE